MKNKVRLKTTPTLKPDNSIHLKMEWIEVDDASNPVGVLAVEEFIIAVNRRTCAYVSRAEFAEGRMLAGTFWIDEQGLRHFYMNAEAGTVGLLGETTKLKQV